MDEEPAAVDDPGDRIVTAREDERSEEQRGGDVQARQRSAGPADHQRAASRGAPHEPEQLREDEHEPRRHEGRARPEERRAIVGDPGRDEEASGQERQGYLQAPRVPNVVAQHHRQEVE